MNGVATIEDTSGLHRRSRDDPPPLSSEIIKLNIGGTRFETTWSTLQNVPNTRLSDICGTSQYYRKVSGDYFFDRSPVIFEHILDFYRTGELHFPHHYCGPSIKKELLFWKIDEADIAPCCWHRFREYEEKKKIFDRIERAFESSSLTKNNAQESPLVAPSRGQIFRRKIYIFLEDPTSSKGAKIWTGVFMSFVLLSIAILCIETHPLFRQKSGDVKKFRESFYSNNLTDVQIKNPKLIRIQETKPKAGLEYIDTACAVFFTIEFVVRFLACPDKLGFWKSPMNLIDVLCVMPMWVKHALDVALPRTSSGWNNLLPLIFVLMVLRVLRIARVLRLARHYMGVKILCLALKASMRELTMLLIFVFIVILIFAIVIFYAEFFVPDTFHSIPEGFWWAIITLTTVGYGDMYPKSAAGYIVGAACALTGILATGLPVPIIASNFNLYYSHAQLKEAASKRKGTKRSFSTLTQISSDPKRESFLLKEDVL